MVCVPAPAVAGSKSPVAALVIPVPDHTPPASTAVRVIDGSEVQNGPTAVIVASIIRLTVISVV